MKPSIPSGMRDFGATELKKRYYIINTIRTLFEQYGYMPLETPTMENLSTLTGKYGDEGDKLLYKVLNSGDFLNKIPSELLSDAKKLAPRIAEKGMRYDLTVPFARYVVMNRNDITFPFRRYQIQPVWRADRPQKGRYREFYQCDADVVGTNSLLNEVELTQIYDRAFTALNLKVIIKLNNRKILQGIAEYCNCLDKLVDMTVAIDKLDKIGREGVEKELMERGFSPESVISIFGCFSTASNPINVNNLMVLQYDALIDLKTKFAEKNIEIGVKGCQELEYVLNTFTQNASASNNFVEFDPTLARGLSYYTGTIWEVKANESTFTSSIGGGGRYDDLTGIFGLKEVSGVGISFGLDRIYDALDELGRFENIDLGASAKVLFINFGGNMEQAAFGLVTQLRQANISAEIYPDNTKMDKQMKYANAKKIGFVAFVGEEELAQNQVKIKNMLTGEQTLINQNQLAQILGN